MCQAGDSSSPLPTGAFPDLRAGSLSDVPFTHPERAAGLRKEFSTPALPQSGHFALHLWRPVYALLAHRWIAAAAFLSSVDIST